MQTQRQAWKIFQPYNVVNIVVSIYLVVIAVCGLYHSGIVSRARMEVYAAKALPICSKTDRKYVVVGGDTLAHIATYYGLKEQIVAAYNHLAEHSTLSVGQSICIQGSDGSVFERNLYSIGAMARVTGEMHLVKPVSHSTKQKRAGSTEPESQSSGSDGAVVHLVNGYAFRAPLTFSSGFVNVFAYGQCTWWAAQRYFQLHNQTVPWTSQANAAQWLARAYDYGWHVSSVATIGSILVLQGGVQGASSLGHVGVVEDVLSDGTAIVSSMNWGYNGGVSLNAFSPGPGVAFVEA